MAHAVRGFVPVLHAATTDRPDEIDTLNAAQAVEGALRRLGYATEIIALDLDLRPLEALARRRPLTVFNLVDAMRGDTRLAPMVPGGVGGAGRCPIRARAPAPGLAPCRRSRPSRRFSLTACRRPLGRKTERASTATHAIIVKPVFEHGSLGLDASSVVKGAAAGQAIKERALRWNTEHFAEAYIEGREFNLAVIERDGAPRGAAHRRDAVRGLRRRRAAHRGL